MSLYGQESPDLEGVYERVSLINLTTGQALDPTQRGLLMMAQGYYSMMTIKPDRPILEQGKRPEDLPKDDQIAFLHEWLKLNAHTGPYEVEGDTLIWHRDLSENPREVGTVSRLPYQLRDDLLVIHFNLSNGSRWEWKWRKIR
jgi:hypothetical protein